MAKSDCTRVHVCYQCKKEFTGRKKKYCSAKCQEAAHCGHDPKGHKCHECWKRFTGRKRKYCSDVCARLAHKRQDTMARRAKGIKPREGNLYAYYHSPEYRRIQRFRKARREGRKIYYKPLPKYRPIYQARKARMKAWRRYLNACRRIDRQVLSAQSRMTPAEIWRWRYRNDPDFRAKEKARLFVQKQRRRYQQEVLDDGTVTAQIIGKRTHCLYCGIKLGSSNRTIDHMDPLRLGGAHSASNITECCKSCNSKKKAKPFTDWLDQLGEPYRSRAVREYTRLHGGPPHQASLFTQLVGSP